MMETIKVIAYVVSVVGFNIEEEGPKIDVYKSQKKGIYEYDIQNINNESMLKNAIVKSLNKLSVKNKILLIGWFDIFCNGVNIYNASFKRFSIKDQIDGQYTIEP